MLKHFGRLGLTHQIVGMTAILSASTVLTLAALTAKFVGDDTNLRSQEGLTARTKLVKDQVETTYAGAQKLVDKSYGNFQRIYRGGFEIKNGVLFYGGKSVDQNDSRPDEFAKETEGVATVFIKSGDDFIRAATSLRNESGSKVLGTALDKSSGAYAKLIRGETYFGAVNLFGKTYSTKYVPIIINGQTVGANFVGYDVTDIKAKLEKSIDDFRYKGSGRTYLLKHDLSPFYVPSGAKIPDAKDLSLIGNKDSAIYETNGKLYAVEKMQSWGGIYLVADANMQDILAPGRKLGMFSMIGGCLASLLLASLMYVMIKVRLRPLVQLEDALGQVGDGDLNLRLSYDAHSKNEVDRMTRSVVRMVESIRAVIGSIKVESASVANTASSLSSTATQLTAAAEAQASGASAMGASVEEMSVSIHSMTDSAAQVADAAKSTQQLVSRGEVAVDSAVARMQEIETHVGQAAGAIGDLGQQSANITKVVEVINDIAGQTNLLALNAAIEAARAGEQGRGFAVVADEVRKLAVRTAESTREINEMVSSIQKGTAGAIHTMEEAVKQVHQGVEQVRDTGQTIHGVSVSAQQAVAAADEIATALREQAQASTLIAQETERVNQTAEETHEAVLQTAGAAQNLQEMAGKLQSAISHFRV